jgi:hypothetical protein
MSVAQFEKTMRDLLLRNPFEPFVVRTDSNQRIVIDNPKGVALAAGGAGYIGPDQIHFIESDQVVEIRTLNA